ncbi:MAG: ABC transporter permease [Gemmatimonadales bacterium]
MTVSPLEPVPTRRPSPWTWQAAVLVATVLLGWEFVIRLGWYRGIFLPAPSAIVRALGAALVDGTMTPHLMATLGRVGGGLAAGATLGLVLGFAMGRSSLLRATLDPLVAAAHPIPKLALLPLFIVLLGIGETPKVVVVAAAAFFPMLINTMAGVRQISPVYFDVARNYGASSWQLVRRVLVPGSVPLVVTGFRLSANVAFLSAVAVEMVMAQTGLGSLLWMSWQVLRVEQLYATLFVIALIGSSLNATLNWAAWRTAPWLSDHHQAAG